MRDTTIAVVSALSPSPTTLAEYGLHFLKSLAGKPGIRVVALVEDRHDVAYPDIAGVEIRKAWRFNAPTNPLRIAKELRRAGADVAIFNAHFTSFGSGKVAATLGLLAPVCSRIVGVPSITLLHNIVETVDLGKAGFGGRPLVERTLRSLGSVVTWMVLRSSLVTTTMPRYVEILTSKYRAANVALTPHGAFDVPEPPQTPPLRPVILAFGKFGTYKRVETLIEAFEMIDRDDVELVIAGTDSPNTPGYLAGVEARVTDPSIHFTGYVPEEEVEVAFRCATLTVFPYTATTGSSGVLHQAGAFGCPPVLPRIGDLEDLIAEEGYTGSFFEPTDPVDLARAICRVLDDPAWREEIALHNYRAACGLPLDQVADWYLIHAGRLAHGSPRALIGRGAA